MKINKKLSIMISVFFVLLVISFVWIKQMFKEPNSESLTKTLPDNLGIQTHIVDSPVDVEAIRNNGFRVIRDDLFWSRIEQKPNEYDFVNTGYDAYNESLIWNGIRPYYILGFSNPLYEKNHSILTEEGRDAYTKFVAEASRRYKNQNTIWEIWNEPNIDRFWSPVFSSMTHYTELVKSASKAIKENDPSGVIVAPALAGTDDNALFWLEETFKKGLLNYVDAISVHPYRSGPPETVIDDYKKIRKLIDKYSKKDVPIISGEWGYSTGPAFYGVQLDNWQQAQYLVRMFLVNMYQGIPISIWYDWKNDGEDKNNGEHNFGIREYDSSIPKEASVAAKVLSKTLSGYHYSEKISLKNKNDFLLKFINKKNKTIYVYWTTEGDHTISLPKGLHLRGLEISMMGESREVDSKNTSLFISNNPAYLKVE